MNDLTNEFSPELNLLAEYSHKLAVESGNKEDQMLAEVLQQHIGRPVTSEDFKDCQMKFYEGRPDEYIFGYKGVDLGLVRRELKMDSGYEDMVRNQFTISYTITFRPIKHK